MHIFLTSLTTTVQILSAAPTMAHAPVSNDDMDGAAAENHHSNMAPMPRPRSHISDNDHNGLAGILVFLRFEREEVNKSHERGSFKDKKNYWNRSNSI